MAPNSNKPNSIKKARASVLLIDDEPVAAQLYSRAIEKQGVEVIVASDVDMGVDMARQYRPRVIVSDVEMPEKTGFDFCDELTQEGLKRAPLLFFTGYDDISVLRQGLLAGGDDFLIKGARLDVLMQRVMFWLGSGFQGLPAAARAKAIKLAKDEELGRSPPIEKYVRLEKALLIAVARQASEEVANVGPHYGARLIERIFFLGRLSHLVLEACTSLGAVVRFPDYLVAAVGHLEFPWIEDLNYLFSIYDSFATDPRFQHAATEGLMEIED